MNIPKIIHYIWVGKTPKPEIVKRCIESWHHYMPDYEIMEWNESNYDISKCLYIKEAYSKKKWAFVSDYMRFDILYNYGGIYFDTDVELLQRIPNNILDASQGFTAMESTGMVSPGLVFAAVSGHPFLEKILKEYNNERFIINGKINYQTVNIRSYDILVNYGFVPNNEFQTVFGLDIFPSKLFCGYDLDIHDYDIDKDTISVHHYASSWNKYSERILIMAKKFFRKCIGTYNYKRIIKFKRKILQKF